MLPFQNQPFHQERHPINFKARLPEKSVNMKSKPRPPEKNCENTTLNLCMLIQSGPGIYIQTWDTPRPTPAPEPAGRVSCPPPPSMLPHWPTLPRTHVTRLTLIYPDRFLSGKKLSERWLAIGQPNIHSNCTETTTANNLISSIVILCNQNCSRQRTRRGENTIGKLNR